MKGILLAGFILTGCAAGGSGPTPKATVLSMEAGLTASEHLALNYVTLPRCETPSTVTLCSSPTVVAAVKRYDQRAYDAITAAQAAVDSDPTASATATQAAMSAGAAALAALQAVTPQTNPLAPASTF